jgi:hypothetical protein
MANTEIEQASSHPREEQDGAFNMEDAEGLESWLPDGSDILGRVAPETAPERYFDESSRLYIGREFTLEEFAKWFAIQGLGSIPFNGIGVHHTFRPVGRDFWGAKTVDAIFSWYHNKLGWKLGKGPHLWLYCGDNPHYRPGQTTVVVGTHPAHDGNGITSRNRYWLHIETFGNWDAARMPQSCVDGLRFLLHLLSARRGQPVKINHGPSVDRPTTWQGALFHRDARSDIKSCPGRTTTHDWFDRAVTEPVPSPDGDLLQVIERTRVRSGPRLDSHLVGRLEPGAVVKLTSAAPGEDNLVRVRFTGYVRRSALGTREDADAMKLESRLMASPRAMPAQSIAHRLAHPHGAYSDADVRWIVSMYYALADDVGLDPLVPDAQGFLETGGLTSWWSQVPRRNPAGIGVTGQPGEGKLFPDWQTAVRAHIGRVLAYAIGPEEETPAQAALIREALTVRPLPDRYRGVAPTVGDWGNGNWATDPGYALKIVRIAEEIRARPGAVLP